MRPMRKGQYELWLKPFDVTKIRVFSGNEREVVEYVKKALNDKNLTTRTSMDDFATLTESSYDCFYNKFLLTSSRSGIIVLKRADTDEA